MRLFSFLKKDRTKRHSAVIDVSDADFKQQVIQRSYKTPVIVDYWAAWCGPCRQLGPVLERLAEEPGSQFILAKLDTENNRRTATEHNIRSIPAVKAFRNGQIVREFTGALPEPLVRRFIDQVTSTPPPRSRIKGSAKPVQRLRQAEQHLKKGRGFEAFVLLNDFPESQQMEHALQLLPMARFLVDMDDGDALTGLDDLDERYESAAADLKRGRPAKALDHLFDALEAGEDIDASYTIGVIDSVLALLGDKDPVGETYRQKLVRWK